MEYTLEQQVEALAEQVERLREDVDYYRDLYRQAQDEANRLYREVSGDAEALI